MAIKTRVLKDNEALNYVQQNPQAQVRVLKNTANIDLNKARDIGINKQIQAERDSRGLLGNFAYDLGKSATALPRALLANTGARGALDTEEKRRFDADKGAFTLQSAANTGSFFVPGIGPGGSLAKIATQGALSGALQGFGNQDLRQGFDIGKIGEGALAGGVTAGALGLGGKLLSRGQRAATGAISNAADDVADDLVASASRRPSVFNNVKESLASKLQKTGKKLQFDSLGFKALPANRSGSLDFVGRLDDTVSRIDDSLAAYKLPRSPEGISKLAGKLGQTQDDIITRSKFFTTGEDFSKQAVDNLRRMRPELSLQKAQAYVDNYVQGLANNMGVKKGLSAAQSINNQFPLDADSLHFIKKDLFPIANKAFSKETTSLGDDISTAIHDTAKEALYSNIPGYKQVNTVFSDLSSQNPNMVTSYNAGNQVSQLGKTDLLNLAQKQGLRQTGKGIESIGNFLSGNNTPRLAEAFNRMAQGGAGGITPKLGAAASMPFVQRAAALGASNQVRSPFTSEEDLIAKQKYTPNGTNSFGLETFDVNSYNSQTDRRALLDEALGYTGGNVQKALQLAEYWAKDNEGRKLTPEQRKNLQDINTAIGNIGLLEGTIKQFSNRFGPIQGAGVFDSVANVLDPERSRVQTTVKSLVQSIAKDLEGGKLTDADREFYNQFMISTTDTQEQALQKLQALADIARSRQNSYLP